MFSNPANRSVRVVSRIIIKNFFGILNTKYIKIELKIKLNQEGHSMYFVFEIQDTLNDLLEIQNISNNLLEIQNIVWKINVDFKGN